MNTFYEKVGMALAAIAIVFAISVLSGTILWAIYPHIHALFPTAAINGIIAKDLSWWDSVCITWLFSILLKSSSSSSSKEKK